jgi:hypothetical protein
VSNQKYITVQHLNRDTLRQNPKYVKEYIYTLYNILDGKIEYKKDNEIKSKKISTGSVKYLGNNEYEFSGSSKKYFEMLKKDLLNFGVTLTLKKGAN